MYLRQLIESRLNSADFKLFTNDGKLIPAEKVKEEYQAIRNYLLNSSQGDFSPVAIKLKKDYRYFLTILSCMEIGLPYIPMKHDYPENRIEQIKEDSKFRFLVDETFLNQMLTTSFSEVHPLPALSEDAPLYIIFTSGSTGRPKGVVIQRKALSNFFQWMDIHFTKIDSNERLLQVTEFTFDISLMDVGLFLLKNVDVYFSEFEGNIFKLGYEIQQYKITTLNTVPNNLNMFLTDLVADRMDYRSLKHIMIGGSRFSYGLYQKCQQYFSREVDIFNLYGPTECTVYSHVMKLNYEESLDCIDGNISIGKPLSNVEAMIEADGKEAASFERGELLLSGIQLLKEYVNNPEQTQKALITFNGSLFYKTGDLAYKDEVGRYFIVGRNDDTIKSRGFRINLLDIDSYIQKVPYIQDCTTIAVESDVDNQTIAYMILKELKTVKQVKKDLATYLLDYQIPEKILFVESYPTNVSGKVCRKTLKAQYIETNKKA